ncbi:hypothetical protein ACFSTD_12920 [Novosphingobium colocasiae]
MIHLRREHLAVHHETMTEHQHRAIRIAIGRTSIVHGKLRAAGRGDQANWHLLLPFFQSREGMINPSSTMAHCMGFVAFTASAFTDKLIFFQLVIKDPEWMDPAISDL